MKSERHTIVAIVGYRNAGDIRACLTALSNSAENNFAISICENGGADAYDSLLASLNGLVEPAGEAPPVIDPRVTKTWSGRLKSGEQPVRIYLANDNLGYAGGVNVCIRQIAPSENWTAVWVLNPDTEPHPDALGALNERALQGYDIVGSRLVFKESGRVQSYGCRWRPMIASGLNLGMFQPQDAVPDTKEIEASMNYVSGAALFVTRAYIENIGLMDERYFLYCEEVDWCLRRGPHRIGYAHNSFVYHVGSSVIGDRSASERSSLSVYLAERNRLLLTRRFYDLLYPLIVLTALIFISRYLRLGAFRNFFVALSGWSAGISGEVGPPARWTKT